MHTLVLSVDDVQAIVRHVGLDALMDEMIGRLTVACSTFSAEQSVVPVRQGFMYSKPAVGLLEWMPCMSAGKRITIKMVGYHPSNPRDFNLPTIVSTIGAYDTHTGHLICLMDGTFLTALRTGAASAVASRIMAAPEARTIGLIGAGAQSVTQLHALTRILDVEDVLVYDINPTVQASFARRVSCYAEDIRIRIAPIEHVVETADVICTATSIEIGQGPVFSGIDPKPWAHFNAIGSDFPGKVELPRELLRQCFVCPDFCEQAVKEGECQQLFPEEIGPSLYEVVQDTEQYRYVQHTLSVFDSTGWALEDHVAMNLLMEYATDLDIGTSIPIEHVSEDAVNPYHFVDAFSHRRNPRQSNVPVTS